MKKIFKEIGNHIVKGITFTVPIIILFSVFSALKNVDWLFGIADVVSRGLYIIIVPMLTALIANSISPKISIIPGIILGYFIESWGLGYLGGIIAGVFLGYLIRCVCKKISIKNDILKVLFGYIVIGLVAGAISYFVMFFMAKPGILFILDGVYQFIENINPTKTIIVVILLTSLTVVDLGGPFNKLAFGFIIDFYLNGFYNIIGPVMIAVMLPPFTVFLGLLVFKSRFNNQDQKSLKLALIGGLFGMTEGALAVGFRRPLKVIPIFIIGSIAASTTAVLLGLENQMILTGILGLFGVNNILYYLFSIVVGVVVILMLFLLVLPNEKELANKE